MLGAEIAGRLDMKVSVICEQESIRSTRAAAIAKQRLQEASLQPAWHTPRYRGNRAKWKAAVGILKQDSDLSDRMALTVRVRGLTTQKASLCLKLIGRQEPQLYHATRAKAFATNALEAVGQRQAHSTPSGSRPSLKSRRG